MTRTENFDWYILLDGEPSGPVTAEALTTLVMKRQLAAGDLVWCHGLASWMPVGAVLGASERPDPLPLMPTQTPSQSPSRTSTHTIYVEAAERRETAHRVVSLSQLYVDSLAERMLAPLPHPLHSSSGIVEAHDAYGAPAYDRLSPEHAAARYVAPSSPRETGSLQPELVELARLVEVSEANADWNSEWKAQAPRPALARPNYG